MSLIILPYWIYGVLINEEYVEATMKRIWMLDNAIGYLLLKCVVVVFWPVFTIIFKHINEEPDWQYGGTVNYPRMYGFMVIGTIILMFFAYGFSVS